MKRSSGILHAMTAFFSGLLVLIWASLRACSAEEYLSPSALAGASDGKTVFVACSGANKVLEVDLESKKVIKSMPMPLSPSGLALSTNDSMLWVTCAGPESQVIGLDLASGKSVAQFKTGHTTTAPVLAIDGKTLFVCNRFNDDVSVLDLVTRKELRRIPVQREPFAAALTREGKYLLVANYLPNTRADLNTVAAVVSVIDIASSKVIKELQLPNGSASLCDISVSPDGKFAVVTFVLSRYNLPTTQIERGWMNTNAKTIIDLAKMEILNTVLLDDVDRGASNPWGVAWSADSTTLVIAHSGTHELSVINFPGLLEKLAKIPVSAAKPPSGSELSPSHTQADVLNDLAFLVGLRQRVKLPESDLSPRALTRVGNKICSANYFSDNLSVVDLKTTPLKAETVSLGPKKEMSQIRKGQFYFQDASICFQGWQSCASCHPGEARVDALNWDLLNDGIGNPKNARSLLLAHQTPPVMSLGIRDSAETAVRSGLKFVLFSLQPPEVSGAIDVYLKSLQPVPSPALVHGELSPAAKKGQKIFQSAGCADCHVPGLYTDLSPWDVGTRGPHDKPKDNFYTPTLIEIWRTAPYLHNGAAATIRDVVTTNNPKDRHGKTSNLTEEEIRNLCTYVLSL